MMHSKKKKDLVVESVEEAIQRGVKITVLQEGEKARKPRPKKVKVDVDKILEKATPEEREQLLRILNGDGATEKE